jgi:2-polyprenyl-6-hydroxyphenyl methylase/3-demethylubiquinone-9 3-methyltransferase
MASLKRAPDAFSISAAAMARPHACLPPKAGRSPASIPRRKGSPWPASGLDLRVGSAYDDLAGEFGRWPFVLCLEVVEHVCFPHRLAATLFDLCEPGARAVVSTPYHGYCKNLALSLVPGAWDRHHHPLSDHGHIKFWSERTLRSLLLQAGFTAVRFKRAGRIPALAKSMLAVAEKT